MQNKRELLIGKATELFSQGGYNAIGIDRIIAEANVAKMTMYKHFPSKNALILAVLSERDKEFMQSLMSYVEQFSSFSEKLKALFVWHHTWFKREDFHGCMFINASAEFHNPSDAIHQLSAQHKQHIIDYIQYLLKDASCRQAKKLAVQITMLLDGAIVAAHVMGNLNSAMEAWEIAQCITNV